MRTLSVFNQVSIDGYFTDANSDMSWAHEGSDDTEFKAFVSGNASGGGTLVFGRKTYELMASFWPTPQALESMPDVAKQMNALPKVVFSRTLTAATWSNTTLVKGDLATEMRKLKQAPGKDMVIMGSGTIVSQLAQEGLIDAYQFVVSPIVLGKGRSMFDGVTKRLDMKRTNSRAFGNGKVLLDYEPVK